MNEKKALSVPGISGAAELFFTVTETWFLLYFQFVSQDHPEFCMDFCPYPEGTINDK